MRRFAVLGLASCLLAGTSARLPALAADQPAAAEDPYVERRQAMVDKIAAEVQATRRYVGKDHLDPRVMEAIARVPRHEFVPGAYRSRAYDNRPLAIGHGQTISQPYVVALMTDLLELEPGDVVLEVGTGSGYQAAVLAELARRVYTIEIVEPLAERARQTLARLGYDNVEVRIGDGYRGWPEHAPFDAIIVTAAPDHVPQPLIEQLAPGGRMVLPVGKPYDTQDLLLVEKSSDGEVTTRTIIPVAFVPLTGDHQRP